MSKRDVTEEEFKKLFKIDQIGRVYIWDNNININNTNEVIDFFKRTKLLRALYEYEHTYNKKLDSLNDIVNITYITTINVPILCSADKTILICDKDLILHKIDGIEYMINNFPEFNNKATSKIVHALQKIISNNRSNNIVNGSLSKNYNHSKSKHIADLIYGCTRSSYFEELDKVKKVDPWLQSLLGIKHELVEELTPAEDKVYRLVSNISDVNLIKYDKHSKYYDAIEVYVRWGAMMIDERREAIIKYKDYIKSRILKYIKESGKIEQLGVPSNFLTTKCHIDLLGMTYKVEIKDIGFREEQYGEERIYKNGVRKIIAD